MPYGLESFAKPDIARSCVKWLITEYINAISCVDFAKPCLAGFAKLLSLKGKLWIVAILVGALHVLILPTC